MSNADIDFLMGEFEQWAEKERLLTPFDVTDNPPRYIDRLTKIYFKAFCAGVAAQKAQPAAQVPEGRRLVDELRAIRDMDMPAHDEWVLNNEQRITLTWAMDAITTVSSAKEWKPS